MRCDPTGQLYVNIRHKRQIFCEEYNPLVESIRTITLPSTGLHFHTFPGDIQLLRLNDLQSNGVHATRPSAEDCHFCTWTMIPRNVCCVRTHYKQ